MIKYQTFQQVSYLLFNLTLLAAYENVGLIWEQRNRNIRKDRVRPSIRHCELSLCELKKATFLKLKKKKLIYYSTTRPMTYNLGKMRM